VTISSSNLGLNILAAHSRSRNPGFSREFSGGVQQVIGQAALGLHREHPTVPLLLHPRSGPVDLSTLDLEHCAFAIVDVSTFDDEVASLIGMLRGIRIPFVLVCSEGQPDSRATLAWAGGTAIAYRDLDELFRTDGKLFAELTRALSQAPVLQQLVHALWFPADTTTIWIVCPQIRHPGEFADRGSLDYTYLDNLGDTDALLEVMVFLSRFYPNATIEKFSADDLPRGHVNSNLVVIGGPGTEDDIGNRICQEMMTMMGASVSYSADCDCIIIRRPEGDREELTAETQGISEQGHRGTHFSLRKDYGYFARFPNPLNGDATVILLNGIHTAGVRGAARVFGDRREAIRNFHEVFQKQNGHLCFESVFEVGVLYGDVMVPLLQATNILPLGPTLPVPRPVSAPSLSPEGRVNSNSIPILFIAGDRGGGQRNQIQIPRELEAIQSALRACKHRDAMSLATPILAATHKKIAEAYRQRPLILHFAGHGDQRALSVIQEQGDLVTVVPLEATSLVQIVKQFPERIRICILNACNSGDIAKHLVDNDAVDAAIGWPSKITDSAAIHFSSTLYGALGDGIPLVKSWRLASEACGVEPELHRNATLVKDESLIVERN
jgi:hypothetical protein